jgi:ribosome maturation factor RimP
MSGQPADIRTEGQRLKEYLEPTVGAHGLYLEDVEVRSSSDHRTVNVIVDLPEGTGSVDLDTLTAVSHALSAAMDDAPADPGPAYDLEVSTRGVGRPLTTPRHWRRSLGRLVRIELAGGEALGGRLTDVEEAGITVIPTIPVQKGTKPKQGEPRQLGFGDIRHAVVDVDFSRSGPLDDEVLAMDDEAEEA